MSQEIVTFKLRRGTTSQWNAATTKLAQGEPGVDTTTGQLKIGNGSSSWNQLKTFYPATQPPANFVDETTPVNIGYEAGTTAGVGTIAIGSYAGSLKQGDLSIAMGYEAGRYNQKDGSVSIGIAAGQTGQGEYAIAVGIGAGRTDQETGSVAIGLNAGQNTQGQSSVAIGTYAGQTNQGQNSIAIGLNAGYSDQAPNTIILNATGNPLNGVSGQTGSFYVAPIRGATSSYTLQYNPTTYEVTYGSGQHGGGASSGVTGTVQLSDGLGGFTGLENIYANTYGNLVLNTTLDLKTGSILDSSGKTGTTGQFLSSGVSGGKVEWIDTPTPSVLQYGFNSVNTNGMTGDIDVIASGLQGDINLIAKNGWVSLQSDFCSFTVGGNNGATRGSLIYTDATAISASSAELHVQSISDNSVLGSIGTAGQLLSAGTTGGSLIWIDAPTGGTYPQDITCQSLTVSNAGGTYNSLINTYYNSVGGYYSTQSTGTGDFIFNSYSRVLAPTSALGVASIIDSAYPPSNGLPNQVLTAGSDGGELLWKDPSRILSYVTDKSSATGSSGTTGQILSAGPNGGSLIWIDAPTGGSGGTYPANINCTTLTATGAVNCGGVVAGTTASGSGTGIAANSVGGKIGMYSVTGQLKIQAEDVSNNNLPLYLNPAYGQTGEFSVFTGGDLVVGNSTGSTAGASGTMYAGSGQINQNFTQNPNQTPGYGASFGSLLQANGGLTVTGLLTASSIMASGSTGTTGQILSAGANGGSLEWVNGISNIQSNANGSYITIGNLLIQTGFNISVSNNLGYAGLSITFPTAFSSVLFITATPNYNGNPPVGSPTIWSLTNNDALLAVAYGNIGHQWIAIGTAP